ncbi:MAG TPA: ABC transporter permease [Acidobacteriaceae bacterium]|nr:ABC transporter permease [Acidobacteriaceae bacterium]
MSGAWQRTRNRILSYFRKDALDRDLDAEIAEHLELAIAENLRSGMTPEEARRRALVQFGGVQRAREEQRAARGLPFLDVLGQDARFALRTMRRDPGFTTVAVLILALGIGANVAVFTVVNTMLLRPLPFPESDRLVWVQGPPENCGMSCITYSVDAFEGYQQRTQTMQSVTAYFPFGGPSDYKLTGHGEAVPVSGIRVEGNFFQVLGVQPMLGRLFSPDETRLHGSPAVLLSYYFWQRQFHGDRSIVGQTITLNEAPVTVAGVLPPTFDFSSVFAPGTRTDLFVPAINDDMRNWGNVFLIVGRMKPGVSVAQARDEAHRLFPDFYFNNSHPDWGKGYQAYLQPLREHVSGALRRSLELLWCAVGLIQLIVCVNLSNLLLARAAARRKEFAMRTALGAGRARIVRQLLTESLILSSAGALLGLGIAAAITFWLAHEGSIALPLLSHIGLDRAALGWTVLVAIATAALFGMAPAQRLSGRNMQQALKDSGPGTSAGRHHEAMRSALVIAEVALACVLLVSAGLLLRSFIKVLDIDLGFRPDRAAAIKVDYKDWDPVQKRSSAAKRAAIFEPLLRKVKTIPGIQDAGITDMLPLDRNRTWNLAPKGVDCRKQDCPDALVQIVTPGYLDAIGIRLRAGRDFTWSDGPGSAKVVILNVAAAQRLWPGQDPIGRIVNIGPGEPRVIGVVDDIRDTGVEGGSDGPQAYLPLTQAQPTDAQLVVRTALPPQVLAGSVLQVLRSLNPAQPATEFRPLRQLVDHAVSPRRFFMLLVSVFAGLGLLLVSLGIYGVIAYSVTQQTQAIGIRMALGASRARVQAHVLVKTFSLALCGMGAGIALSVMAARAITSLLYGTQPTDPLTYAGMIALLLSVAGVAGYLPARRASRIDPLVALRSN